MFHNRSRRTQVAIGIVVLLAVFGANAAGASPSPGDDHGGGDRSGPRIVGGTEAAAGAWPSQVAVLFHSVPDNYDAQYCGGTTLSRSWVLTAGHCVTDPSGTLLAPSQIDVLTGTQDLEAGGRRLRSAEIRLLPGFNRQTLKNDLALIRLDTPANTPAMPIVSQGSTVPTGTSLTTTGWGLTFLDPPLDLPAKLRQVAVPTTTDTSCKNSYSSSVAPVLTIASMFCAGFSAGGKDSCNGDSGGPISRKVGSTWTQVGIVSWGDDCAAAGKPGVYTRLSAFSDWVKAQVKYGPFSNATAFVRQQYRDIFGREITDSELDNVLQLAVNTGPGEVISGLVRSEESRNVTGMVPRLYRAFFNRNGDTDGLRYWVARARFGLSRNGVAAAFAGTAEFEAAYDHLNDTDFVKQVYLNTLGRTADSGGLAYWTGRLAAGTPRSQVMSTLAGSAEFETRVGPAADVTVTYLDLVQKAPTDDQILFFSGGAASAVATYLFSTMTYVSRF